MTSPTVIPRPAALRRRDAVARLGPALVMVIALGLVAFLWHRELFPNSFVGEAQSPSATVSAPAAGRLQDLLVEPYTLVTNGQVLGHVAARSQGTLQTMIEALRSDLEVMRVRMMQDQERNDLNRAQLNHDLLVQRLELAGARIRLRQVESEFERVRLLYEARAVAAGVGPDADGYEVALRDRDLTRAEVADKERLVAVLEKSLEAIGPAPEGDRLQPIHDTIARAIEAQEDQVRALEGPSVLRASIDGMVMRILRQPGENVAAEEPLLEIRGNRPQWILGFIRQPINFRPQPGDVILVISRSTPRRSAEARVIRVGAHLEVFSQPLRARGFDASLERGLPVLIDYPPALDLQPGELVDLRPLGKR
jgi:multidrug resistance efflux pump